MEQQEQDRSEQPTVFKLARAREKGMVARGTDLGFFTSLATFLGLAWIMAPRLGGALSDAMRSGAISGSSLADGNSALIAVAGSLFAHVVPLVAVAVGAVFTVVLLFEIV